MKNIYRILTIILIVTQNLRAQSPIDVCTPNGRTVNDTYIYPERILAYDIQYIDSCLATDYPNAQKLQESTTTYNCHAYAWHMTEGGSAVWMGRNSNPTSIYWTDGSYVETANPSESTKVSYASDNHSAITTSQSGVFISKWGSWALMRHLSNDSPYNSSDLRYYKKAPRPSVSGSRLICSSGASFTIYNLPSSVESIVWECGSRLQRISSQDSNPCTFSSTGNGSSWIRAKLVTECDTVTTAYYTVWAGTPQVSAYGGHIVDIHTGMPLYDLCYGTANEAEAVHPAGNAYITDWDWRASYGQVYPYGADDQYATIYPNSYQSFMLEIRAGNACGYSGWAHMYTNVVDCGRYLLVFTPNPTTGETMMSIKSESEEKTFDETAEWEMEIYSQSRLLMEKKTRLYGQNIRIHTAGWKEGVYIVRVLYKGEVLTGRLIVAR